jgi:hypothetical protein
VHVIIAIAMVMSLRDYEQYGMIFMTKCVCSLLYITSLT